MCNNGSINNSFNTINNPNDILENNCYSNLPSNLRYGNAYVPVQTFRTVYSPSEGLARGTMFPELVSTYYPNQSLAEINYLKNYNESRCRM